MDDAKPQEPEPIDAEVVEDSSTALSVPAPPPPAFDYTEGGVPTFDYVRDKIENKFTTSIGANELAAESPQGKSVDEQMTERDQAARDKLEEIRRQMRGE